MSTLNEQLSEIQTARNDIKTALENKGQIVTKDIRTYAEAISNITSGGSTEIPVKLFETEEEMQADETAKEEDLAVVYNSPQIGMTVDDQVQYLYFPKIVTLDTAVTATTSGYLVAVSGVGMDGPIRLNTTSFTITWYGSAEEIYIEYVSSDGITYTRTDSYGDIIDFGELVEFSTNGAKHAKFAPFMLIPSSYFGGLFKSTPFKDTETFYFQTITDPIEGDYVPQSIDANQSLDKSLIENTVNSIFTELGYTINDYVIVRLSDTLYDIYAVGTTSKNVRCNPLIYVDGKTYMGKSTLSAAEIEYKISLDITNLEAFTTKVLTTEDITPIDINGSEKESYADISNYSFDTYKREDLSVKVKYGEDSNTSASITLLPHHILKYVHAPTQLSAKEADLIEGKSAYSSSGLIEGTIGAVISSDFNDETARIYGMAQFYYDSLPTVELSSDDSEFAYYPSDITCIPLRSDGSHIFDISKATRLNFCIQQCQNLHTIVGIDTSNITTAGMMFYVYTKNSLVNIPVMDFGKVTSMDGMVTDCVNLSDASLNNLMATMLTATSYTGTKTLAILGVTESQAARCQTLSNYEAFVAAGWTTGY